MVHARQRIWTRSFVIAVLAPTIACGDPTKDPDQPPVATYTAEELQNAMSIADATAVQGAMPTGSDSADMPQITHIDLPDAIVFGELFQVTVTFQTGAKSLAKLLAQVEGASGYLQLTAQFLPHTAGEVSFPVIISTPNHALTYSSSVALKFQLTDEDGDAGLPVTSTIDFGASNGETGDEDDGGSDEDDTGGIDEGPSCEAPQAGLPAGSVTNADGVPAAGAVAHTWTGFAEGGLSSGIRIQLVSFSNITACALLESGHVYVGESYFFVHLTTVDETEPPLPEPGTYHYSTFDDKEDGVPYLSSAGPGGGFDHGDGTCSFGSSMAPSEPSGSITITAITDAEISGSFTYSEDGTTYSAGFVAPICARAQTEACCYASP